MNEKTRLDVHVYNIRVGDARLSPQCRHFWSEGRARGERGESRGSDLQSMLIIDVIDGIGFSRDKLYGRQVEEQPSLKMGFGSN